MDLAFQLIKAVEEKSFPAIHTLLETYLDPNANEGIEPYKRYEDCSSGGSLSIMFLKNGEVRIEILSRPDPGDTKPTLPPILCFRKGGQSPHTYALLLALIVAIKKDNDEKPQRRSV